MSTSVKIARALNAILPFGWKLYHPSALTEARKLYYYLGPDRALTTTDEGHFIYVDPRDNSIAIQLIVRGCWEPRNSKVLELLLKPGDNVVEVGANHGYFTLQMARMVGRTGAVHAFEANGHLCRLIRDSVVLNGYGGIVTLTNAVAADRSGTMRFVTSSRESGGGHVLEGAGDFGDESIFADVTAIRLDDEFPTQKVDLIRIDAEGSEPLILAGARHLIERERDIRIFMEWDVIQMGPRVDLGRFIGELAASGFRFFKFDDRLAARELNTDELITLPHSDILLSRTAPTK